MAEGIKRVPTPRDLRCEYMDRPLGIDELKPRLSWRLEDAGRGTRQTAYRILVASSPEILGRDRGDLWDSGRVKSDKSVHVEYSGKRLASRLRCWWKVRTWDGAGKASAWSEPAWWEMGLLSRADWTAQWIGLRDPAVPPPCTFLRRSFRIEGKVKRARLYVTSLGVYEVCLNGKRIGDHRFAPGWTDYRWRVMYQAFDVEDALVEGENAAGAILGEGWYCGALTWTLKRNCFGDPPPRLLFQLEVDTECGKTERIVSDGSWKATNNGPIRSSEIYAGETYDARLEMPGWDRPGFMEGEWKPVEVFADPGIAINAQADPPIRATQELKPVAISQPVKGTYIFDMGQNMVGVCRLRIPGNVPPGTTIRLRHGEELKPDGTLYVENLRKAHATDTYIASGSGRPETWTPRFTYHGFRYVELTGYPGTPVTDMVTGLVVHTDARPAASFESSCPTVNRLWRNIEWGQRGNMFSVLTDCPQRDERLGWMGDAMVFCRTACTNMDMAAMLAKFARDMRDAQAPSGAFMDVAPYISGGLFPDTGAPCWADAGIVVPWTVYEVYGDRRILERSFDAMRKYVGYLARNNPSGLWVSRRGNDYGDWVSAGGQTDKTMLATLQFFQSATLLSKAASVVGRRAEAKRYAALAGRIAEAFNAHFLKDGRYEKASQTINAMALALGVVPKEHREKVLRDLVEDIERRGCRLSTGFIGTKWLLQALTEGGRADLARKLLLRREYPSWGYMIERGATTIWELWDSDRKGPDMNSRNHFAFGSVGEWIVRYLAGIDIAPGGAGYSRILIRPYPDEPDGELRSVKASLDTMYGKVSCEWEVSAARFDLFVRIPPNTVATVAVPAASVRNVTEGGRPLCKAPGIRGARVSGGRVICSAGSGEYEFSARR